MLLLLSPAKTLDFSACPIQRHSSPAFIDQSEMLIKKLRNYSEKQLCKLMGISEKIGRLNKDRYSSFSPNPVLGENAKQSLLAFKGDVYRDWPLGEYDDEDLDYAQDHLRILSGLYGALRPLDLIQPHRLEMGTRLKTRRGKSLYDFWGSRITQSLNDTLAAQREDLVVNLASNEYFGAIRTAELNGRVISPVFKDAKNGQYKLISFFAKCARGQMAHYLIKERVTDLDGLKRFTLMGYRYDAESSTADKPVFLRDHN